LIQTMGMLQMDPRDKAMMNTYSDAQRSMMVVPTFRFIAPKEILFDVTMGGRQFIVECKCVHDDLSTIPSDIYHEIFKEMALAEIIDTIVQMRKKYRTMSTPFGEIQMNWEDLQQRYDQLKSTVQEKLDSLPPDRLIDWV
jgi:hypothetical protein